MAWSKVHGDHFHEIKERAISASQISPVPLCQLLLFCLYFRFFSTSSRTGFKATDPSSGI